MPFQVKILPGGQQFEASARESLLDAALRAGLAPAYHCSDGSCGACKARLVSGSLGEERAHPYRFSESERTAGQFLLCACAPASNLVIETALAGGARDIPVQDVPARVEAIQRLGDEVAALVLRTPPSHVLRFVAGQYVHLAVDGLRPYNKSIASCPCHGERLEFHVHRTSGDVFAEHVFTRLRIGERVGIRGPWGNFALLESSRRPAIFIACETGLAPIKSIIEQAIAREYAWPMHLYWVVRRGGGHYLDNWARSLVASLEHFAYTPLVVPGGGSASEPLSETVHRVLADHAAIADFDVYACAPIAAVREAQALFSRHGLPPGQFFTDSLTHQ